MQFDVAQAHLRPPMLEGIEAARQNKYIPATNTTPENSSAVTQ
jgi:hypothetical protein